MRGECGLMLKVLMVTSEAEPFAKTGGLGDVLGGLPKALAGMGGKFDANGDVCSDVDIRVIMPKYAAIPQQFKSKMKFVGKTEVALGWRTQYCGVMSLVHNGVTFYFIDNEYYFGGESIYEFRDFERFTFFSKGVLAALPVIDFFPDVMHCHDWQTGIIPMLLDAEYRADERYAGIKTMYTIHNLAYQGIHGVEFVDDLLRLPREYYGEDKMGFKGNMNCMKAGIVFADYVSTVSPTYAEEIKTAEYGEGLEWLIRERSSDFGGILNGVDYQRYSPKNNTSIPCRYDCETFAEGKAANKRALQERMGLPINPEIPVISMVTRLTSQKGVDLVIKAMARLSQRDFQLIVLGTGDVDYENALRSFEYQYRDKMRACIMFSNELSHHMYAGSDMFLMPSLYEPCGLGQVISLAFGTLPIVRETGGLTDTVTSYNEVTGEGNGFSFAPYNENDMVYTIDRALNIYRSPLLWQKIVRAAMECDYSWGVSAKHYMKIYKELKAKRKTVSESAKQDEGEGRTGKKTGMTSQRIKAVLGKNLLGSKEKTTVN